MRLIDADALMEKLKKTYKYFDLKFYIDEAPTIDAVHVVRCTECRHWNAETRGCKRNPSVEAWQEDDFCKYGKRWSNAID